MSPSPEFAAYSDAILIKLVAEYHLHAFETLYDRHAPVVYNLILKITGEASIAEAMLHEVFWQIWCEPHVLQNEENLMPYFCRVARRISLQQLRQSSSQVQLSS